MFYGLMQSTNSSDNKKTLEEIANFAKRYGFFYPSCEIYGGKAGFYDYGSIGAKLKRKFEDIWRKYFGSLFDNIWEIEPTNIMHEKVFIASKHLELFNDPVTECKNGHRFRADKLIEEKLGTKADSLTIDQMNEIFRSGKIVCPECGKQLSDVRMFNLMFPIFIGPESGNMYLYLNELKEFYYKRNNIIKVIEKRDPTFVTEDGYEFIAVLKEYFDDRELYYIEKDNIFYLFDKEMKNVMILDTFTRKATFYLSEKLGNINELVEKYKDLDVEMEFEKILEKAKPYLKYTEEDLADIIEDLARAFEESLKNRMFLRPETAQGPYVNFPQEIIIHRNKLPLGLMVIGKAFRNEISPRQLLLRLREFTQAELQIFFDIEEWSDENFDKHFDWDEIKSKKLQILPVKYRDREPYIEKTIEDLHKELNLPKFYLYFMYKVQELGIPKDRFRLYELDENERSFYNKYHFDVELYLDELGWIEVGGIHFRAIELKKEDVNKINNKKIRDLLLKVLGERDKILVGYDLYNHLILSEETGFILTKPDGRKILPVELELSFGIDRNIFALIWISYSKELVNKEERIVLRLKPYIAPIEVAVLPLLESKKELVRKAKEVYNLLKDFDVVFDSSGSIGRRYRRQDAIGTPFCITIDYQTLEDNTVTIRFRDTMEQIRVHIKYGSQ